MIPSKAVRKALATHLATRLSLAADAVLPDWPPASKDLPRPVAITVIDAGAVGHDTDLGGPELVSITPTTGALATAVYRLGAWRIPLSVELWCSTAFERDTRAEQIHAALNEPPSIGAEAQVDAMAGLALVVADYHGAIATFDAEGWDARPVAEGTAREEWRARFEVVARVDELVTKTVTRQVSTEITVAASPAPLT